MPETFESVVDAALQLDPSDRCRVAARLWESVGQSAQTLEDEAFESLLNQREADLENDPAQEVSREDFSAHFAARRHA